MLSKSRLTAGALAAACVIGGAVAVAQGAFAAQVVAGHAIASPTALRGPIVNPSTSTSAAISPDDESGSSSTVAVPLGPTEPSEPVTSPKTSPSGVPTAVETSHAPAPDGRTTVAFIGDSYTNGTGASDHSKRWTDLVSAAHGWDEVNLGAGGTGYVNVPSEPQQACGRSSCPTYVEQAQLAVEADPQIVIVSGGRNDLTAVAHEPDRVRSAVDRVFSTLRAGLPHARIIVIAPFWDSTTPSSRIAELASWIRVAAQQYGADFIPDAAQYLAGQPNAIWHDGIHPNDLGYAIIAERVDQALASVLATPLNADRSPPRAGMSTEPPTAPPAK